jgi:hypothetical protein
MKQVLAALFLLSFAFGAKTALAQGCDPCPATHCLSQTVGQGCGPIGTCNINPPYCDAGGGGGGGGGATSSVMFDFTVAQSVNSAFSIAVNPNPGGPYACVAAQGTILATISWTGGDNKVPVFSISGATDGLSISGSSIIVGSNFPASICGLSNSVTVTGTQPP